MKSLFRSAKSKMLVLKLANYLIGAVVAIALARFLGAEGYGSYAFVFSIVLILVLPAGFGLPYFLLRETVRLSQDQRNNEIGQIWRWSGLVILASSALIFLLVYVVTRVTGYGPASPELFWLGMLVIPFMAGGAVRAGALQALGYPFAAQFPQMVLRQGLLVVIFLLAAYFSSKAASSPETAMAANLAGAIIAFGIGLYLLSRVAPPMPSIPPISAAPHRMWLTSAFWMGTGQGAQKLNGNMDIILLGILATASDVGIYKAVVVAGTTTIFAVQAIELALMPRLAKLAIEGDKAGLVRASVRAAREIMAFGGVIIAGLVIFGETLLNLAFGAEFSEGYVTLLIVALGKASFYLFGPVRPLLNMTGNEKHIGPVMAQAVVVNIAACIILIPYFGYLGAACALLISSWFWNIRLYLLVRLKLGFDCSAIGRPSTKISAE